MREDNALTRLAAHGVNEIPDGWRVSKVKYLADYFNGYPFKPVDWGDIGKPIIRIQNLTDFSAEANRYDAEIAEIYLVKSGDFLISWSASLGLHVWNGEPAWLNQHIFRVDLYEDKCTRNFFRWLATWFMEELARDSHGSTMQHLTKDAFGSFPLLIPEKTTQIEIAEFLDSKTAKLDELISAKQNLLKLLAEKRRALITQAVTKGLDSSVMMKDSCIPWLGEVPVHWDVIRLKRALTDVQYGTSESVNPSGKVGILRMGDIKDGEIYFDKIGFLDDIESFLLLKQGDLVFNRTNSLDQIGKVGLIRELPEFPLSFASYLVRLRPNNKIYNEYLNFFLNCSYTNAYARSEALPSIGQANLNPDRFGYLNITIPPIKEQEKIICYIKTKVQSLDKLSAETERTIKLLKERRSALISDAVTGKIHIESMGSTTEASHEN